MSTPTPLRGRLNRTLEAKERGRNYIDFLVGLAASVIDEKEFIGRIAGDNIYTDRVEYPVRMNGTAVLGCCIQRSCSARAQYRARMKELRI